jgi:hypothetical protein
MISLLKNGLTNVRMPNKLLYRSLFSSQDITNKKEIKENLNKCQLNQELAVTTDISHIGHSHAP